MGNLLSDSPIVLDGSTVLVIQVQQPALVSPMPWGVSPGAFAGAPPSEYLTTPALPQSPKFLGNFKLSKFEGNTRQWKAWNKSCTEMVKAYLPLCPLHYHQVVSGKTQSLLLKDGLGSATYNSDTHAMVYPPAVPKDRLPIPKSELKPVKRKGLVAGIRSPRLSSGCVGISPPMDNSLAEIISPPMDNSLVEITNPEVFSVSLLNEEVALVNFLEATTLDATSHSPFTPKRIRWTFLLLPGKPGFSLNVASIRPYGSTADPSHFI